MDSRGSYNWWDIIKDRWSDFVEVSFEWLSRIWRFFLRCWAWIEARPFVRKALVVLIGLVVSTGFAFLFKPLVRPESQFLLYLPAVMVSALFAGMAWGIGASAAGALLTTYLFILPAHTPSSDRAMETVALVLYLMASALILVLNRLQEHQRQQILNFAETLEQKVAERTADLQQANEELQSFCYSISHDLRAPMRNIVGSSRIIIEDLGPRLDPEARENLLSIGVSANRLAQLVDDLLNHARIGHSAMNLEKASLSAMAEGIAAELLALDWGYPIEFDIEPNMTVVCDVELIRLALRNLMENSCKYAHEGRILNVRVGETRRKGMPVYYVRDNGIGFDMQYIEKIFQPFQRLHRDVDYPGTGIGLANVKRVMDRHAGDLWAEGEVGKGATFYFMLGRLNPDRIAV
ncbi:MAG: ATP-binding protein [Fimbriimonadaceae bacterium]